MDPNKPYKICKYIKNYENSIKLDLNEFDFDHHPDFIKNINNVVSKNKAITHYSNFYNNNTQIFINKLASFNGVDINNIIVTAGSDDSLEYIVNKFINVKTTVFIFVPSYNYFELLVKSKTDNIIYIPIGFDDNNYDISYCLDFYKSQLVDNSVVYIVNPSNPLGTTVTNLQKSIKKYNNTLFIIDEAYIEFCPTLNSVNLIENKNVIITRTFSKAYGLAGLRLGYSIANTKIIDTLKVVYNEKNVTEIAKNAGIFILDHIDYYNDIIQRIHQSKVEFESFLNELNIYFVHSYSNFVSFYIGDKRLEFLQLLENNNVFIRDRHTQVNMNGFLRITIGTSEHMRLIKKLIKDNLDLFSNKCVVKYFTNKPHIWKLKLLFKTLLDCFSQNELINKYWMDSGSLLGVYRSNGIISWDDDIDIGVLSSDIPLLISLKDTLESNGLRLKRNRTDCYYQIDYISDISDIYITNDVHIDIFTFNENGNETYINSDPRFATSDSNEFKCNIVYSDNDLFPLSKAQFYNLNVNIPRNTKQLLENAFKGDFKNEGVLIVDNEVIKIDIKKYTNA